MKYLLAILTLSLITISTPVWADDGLVGEWQLRVEGRRGVQTPILQIAQENKKFSGKIGGQRGQIDTEQITVVDETFSFPFAMETPMGDFKLLYKGTRDGDTLTGTVDTPRGQIPFSGKRL